jgi:hypothetical protein
MDEQSSLIIPVLFGVTVVLVLAFVIVSGLKARRARRERRHSVTEMQERGEVPKTYGAGDTER